ncbi:hypothetical protein CIHG_09675 [Coccidioides immitis H538.4]|uniref:Uncharacterized protein n=1 Tax=Coccidioides immitis H538.4 TaxID=396776 RepID=A0A0J8S6A7_COCIT|nr:hypothetical protein CIHG_09675 [Coccidioides immitis H538.4]
MPPVVSRHTGLQVCMVGVERSSEPGRAQTSAECPSFAADHQLGCCMPDETRAERPAIRPRTGGNAIPFRDQPRGDQRAVGCLHSNNAYTPYILAIRAQQTAGSGKRSEMCVFFPTGYDCMEPRN